MIGYCMEIGLPHERQRPRSTSHETIGILSRHAMRRPQRGQVEGGWKRERCFLSSLASRRMHTLDRKSTRLNSSHLGMSYAVFCLKKKNLHRLRDEPTYRVSSCLA